MKIKTFKYGSGVSFEHKGVWYKTYLEAEVVIDGEDKPSECILATKKWIASEIQKEIDEITGD